MDIQKIPLALLKSIRDGYEEAVETGKPYSNIFSHKQTILEISRRSAQSRMPVSDCFDEEQERKQKYDLAGTEASF